MIAVASDLVVRFCFCAPRLDPPREKRLLRDEVETAYTSTLNFTRCIHFCLSSIELYWGEGGLSMEWLIVFMH